jgi:hypothetical protein
MELNLTPAIKRATGAAPQAMLLAAFAISLAGYLWIMGLTRHIFKTLSQGNVFIEANTYRLRQIGIGLMAIEVFGYVTRILTKTMFAINFEPVYGLRVVTTWFAIMVVFVLAEVFSEGARIKNQADFTV